MTQAVFRALLRWSQRDRISAIANGAHEHAGCGRCPGVHPILVLVPAGALSRLGLHAHLPDRPERSAEDAQAGNQIECQTERVRLSRTPRGKETRGARESHNCCPQHRGSRQKTRVREKGERFT